MRKPDTFIHAPWDNGAISANAFFLAVNGPQKTIRTRCDRRVKLAQAPADVPPTCPACIETLLNQSHALAVIQKYADDLQKGGLDYANREANSSEVSTSAVALGALAIIGAGKR